MKRLEEVPVAMVTDASDSSDGKQNDESSDGSSSATTHAATVSPSNTGALGGESASRGDSPETLCDSPVQTAAL